MADGVKLLLRPAAVADIRATRDYYNRTGSRLHEQFAYKLGEPDLVHVLRIVHHHTTPDRWPTD